MFSFLKKSINKKFNSHFVNHTLLSQCAPFSWKHLKYIQIAGLKVFRLVGGFKLHWSSVQSIRSSHSLCSFFFLSSLWFLQSHFSVFDTCQVCLAVSTLPVEDVEPQSLKISPGIKQGLEEPVWFWPCCEQELGLQGWSYLFLPPPLGSHRVFPGFSTCVLWFSQTVLHST